MCMSVCLHAHLCTMYIQYPRKPEEDTGFPGTGVKRSRVGN